MKNPFDKQKESSSYLFFEDKQIKYTAIEDDSSDFKLVFINQTPHCKIHKAMNKVSTYENGGYWRCLQGQCRAGCIEIKPKI